MAFGSVHGNHLGALHVVRAFARMHHDAQMNKAYQTKDKSDFEEAAKTRQGMNLFDVILGLLRLA